VDNTVEELIARGKLADELNTKLRFLENRHAFDNGGWEFKAKWKPSGADDIFSDALLREIMIEGRNAIVSDLKYKIDELLGKHA
jgi:hypothetical protein